MDYMIRLPDGTLGPHETLDITIERDLVETHESDIYRTHTPLSSGWIIWTRWTGKFARTPVTHRCRYSMLMTTCGKDDLVICSPVYDGIPELTYLEMSPD